MFRPSWSRCFSRTSNRTKVIPNNSTPCLRLAGDRVTYRIERTLLWTAARWTRACAAIFIAVNTKIPTGYLKLLSHCWECFFLFFVLRPSSLLSPIFFFFSFEMMGRSSIGHFHNREKLLKIKSSLGHVRRLESIYRETKFRLIAILWFSTHSFGNNNYYVRGNFLKWKERPWYEETWRDEINFHCTFGRNEHFIKIIQ